MSDSTIPVVNSVEKSTADVAGDDKRNADSAVSGVVPKSELLVACPVHSLSILMCALLVGEVEDLKDSLGGGETVDNEAGVTTRGAKNDAYAQEKEVDKLDL